MGSGGREMEEGRRWTFLMNKKINKAFLSKKKHVSMSMINTQILMFTIFSNPPGR